MNNTIPSHKKSDTQILFLPCIAAVMVWFLSKYSTLLLRNCRSAAKTIVSVNGLLIISLCSRIFAAEPPELPGKELTEEQYFELIVPRDSVEKIAPENSPSSPTWLNIAEETWDAPPLASQIAEDKENILMGMGALYVPYMSDPNQEPDFEIVNETGKVVVSDKVGKKISLLPDNYYLILGSGSHSQRIVKSVFITENKITPVFPDWSGLSIDVVDEDNQPFRGEYELARVDKFEPYGRGTGRNPDLGEQVKTWILKPGTYKIFGVGESYNTLTNFVTVRLLPGEYTRFVLVQKDDMTIVGGGTLQMKSAIDSTSNWKLGLDVSGNINFNMKSDYLDSSNDVNNKSFSIIFRPEFLYRKNPIDWTTRFWLKEGIVFKGWDISRVESSPDEIRASSILTWRFLPWLGPYGKIDVTSGLFPQYERIPEGSSKHYFIMFNDDYTLKEINSLIDSYKMEPAFSPFTVEPGIGANLVPLKTRFFETKLLTGIGFKYERIWNQSERMSINDINYTLLDSVQEKEIKEIVHDTVTGSTYSLIHKFANKNVTEIGPEIIMNISGKLGKIASVESELKLFAPFVRIKNPDLTCRVTASWHLMRMLTLDYEFLYMLKQPPEIVARKKESQHSILIRFSFQSK